MDKGLRLGGALIKSISGPSTYAILLPPKDSNLTIQILFGDVHRELRNTCDEKEEYSYFIWDKRFLEIVDSIAKVYPTIFYTESADGSFMKRIDEKDSHLSKLVKTVEKCYSNRRNYEYEEECPTTYLLWEHTDARFFEQSLEGYLCDYTIRFLENQIKFLTNDSFILTHWLNMYETNFNFTEKQNISSCALWLIYSWMTIFIKFSEKISKVKSENEFSGYSKGQLNKLYSELSQLDPTTPRAMEIRDKIYSISEEESGVDKYHLDILEELTEVYLKTMYIDNSSTARQLKKYEEMGGDIETLTRNLRAFPLTHIKDFKDSLRKLFPREKRVYTLCIIRSLLQFPRLTNQNEYYKQIETEALKDVDGLKSCCQALKEFLKTFTQFFLDIFYICRTIQANTPHFSIGYFGNSHTKRIIKFLHTHLKYKIIEQSDEVSELTPLKEIKRCLSMPDVDMDAIILDTLTDERRKNIALHNIRLKQERRDRLISLENLSKQLKDEIPRPGFLEDKYFKFDNNSPS